MKRATYSVKTNSAAKKYHTSIAAEFYVLSMLHRLQVNAHLTLGNNKAVDIIVEKEDGSLITIDVKGLMSKTSFPVDNCRVAPRHFIVFVDFYESLQNNSIPPEVYIVPSKLFSKNHKETDGKSLVYISPKDKYCRVQYSRLEELAKKYKNKWILLIK